MIEEARNLDRSDQREQALKAYRRYLEVQPGDAGAWADYGGLLMVMDQLEDAQKACERALRIDAINPGAMVNLGCILTRQGRLSEAEGWFRRVLVRDPHRIDARLALANSLIRSAALDEARVELGRVIQREPGNPSAHQYLGGIFHRLGLWSDYQEEIDRYHLLDPSSAYVDYERGYLDLLFGDLIPGWEGYEARFRLPGLVGPKREFLQPRWTGESFVGRTLLLHYEQGFGDTLMFLRFASRAKALGGTVLLAVQPPLADLVATCPGVDEVIPHGAPLPSFDLQLPLLSQPHVFQIALEDIPAEVPYLGVPSRVPNREGLAALLSGPKVGIRIGLVWAGSSSHKNDLVRSIPSEELKALNVLPGVAWYSLQPGMAEEAPLPGLTALGPLLSNFSDTAYAMSEMDLIITVDTAPAHLAGALGIPTFLLLPFSPDWRWMLGRADSPWYPTLRIYRQPDPGDWTTVIDQVLSDLNDGE
jgi:hypothetical protein